MSDISNETKTLSTAIAKDLTVTDNGTIEAAKDTYEKTLPEGITMDIVQQLQKHDTTFTAAYCLAFGEAAHEHMEKNKGLKQMSGQVNMGSDTLGATIQRERPYPNPDGGTSTAYGSITPRRVVGSTGNRGDLKKVKGVLSDMFKKAAEA